MSNGDKITEKPVPGHTVIETPEHVDLPPGERDNPPDPGQTVIESDRNLDEPTPKAEEIRQKVGT